MKGDEPMLTIKIHTGGSAFEPSAEYELARILRKCASYLEAKAEFPPEKSYGCNLLDINGNTVGEIRVTNNRR